MKDKNGVEIVPNATVRCWNDGASECEEFVVDGIENGFIVMHNVFGPVTASVSQLTLEVLPERVLTKQDFKSKRE